MPCAASGRPRGDAWPSYFERHQLDVLLPSLVRGLAAHEPDDPVQWLIRELVRSRQPPEPSEVRKAKRKGVGVNISACLRKGCRALLDIVCEENSGWEELEEASDTSVPWA